MNNNEMNNLALKFLNSIKGWVEARIDNRTQGCLRTKVAVIFEEKLTGEYEYEYMNENGLYNVILASDYRELQILNQKIEETTDLVKKEALLKEKKELLERIVFEKIIAIRPDTYKNKDYVTIGYVDNKLTNSFIICKNEKEG